MSFDAIPEQYRKGPVSSCRCTMLLHHATNAGMGSYMPRSCHSRHHATGRVPLLPAMRASACILAYGSGGHSAQVWQPRYRVALARRRSGNLGTVWLWLYLHESTTG